MSNLWPKKWSRSLKKFEQWSLTREFLKQYLTEKQNGGRLREVVVRRELTILGPAVIDLSCCGVLANP